jgi:hypothetical protein
MHASSHPCLYGLAKNLRHNSNPYVAAFGHIENIILDYKYKIGFNVPAMLHKDYGVNGSIPLVKIADRVDVTVNLKVKRISGPALTFKN